MHKNDRPHFGNGRTMTILKLLFRKKYCLNQVNKYQCRMPQTISKVKDDFEVINLHFLCFLLEYHCM